MSRQTRSSKAKGIAPKIEAPVVSKRGRAKQSPLGTQQEYCITCPCCGLMASFNRKDESGAIVDRFTGDPYQPRLFLKRYGGKMPAPEGTPVGQGNKGALGVINYEDITDSEPGIFGDVMQKLLRAHQK